MWLKIGFCPRRTQPWAMLCYCLDRNMCRCPGNATITKNTLTKAPKEDIKKTRLFKFSENVTTKNWKFSDKRSDFFHISAQNIDLRYLLEPPHSTHNLCFWAEIRKIMYIPVNPSFTTLKWGLRESKLYLHVFVMYEEKPMTNLTLHINPPTDEQRRSFEVYFKLWKLQQEKNNKRKYKI